MFAVQGIFYESTRSGVVLHAMPLLLAALCILAIAYRYYSAFLAARVAALDDSRVTPAHTFHDGQNYHPTNKWVLFGHHFAAISGAGPLIGPVLALQYGYMPGLLWLVIGVCLAGAVQDMLVLAASVRRGGKSLAEIARAELGTWASVAVSAAILFIVVIALAGLGAVVVKALGGEEAKLPAGTTIALPEGTSLDASRHPVYSFPEECFVVYPQMLGASTGDKRPEPFQIRIAADEPLAAPKGVVTLPTGTVQVVPGSSWGTFTIACTIPIALFVGLYMYRLRKGHVVEASLIGAAATIGAVIAGAWIPGSVLETYFSLTREQTILALTGYGFLASVLPVWLLLCPRDYLSSFLKIGTIALLVVGVFIANPVLRCPQYNQTFAAGGPTFNGGVFPFVFICIMCGAVSGFHALVSSGTTPKMIDKESHIRPIGYGAMLMEGLVGIVALLTAASLDPGLYYDINVDLSQVQRFAPQIAEMKQNLILDGADDLPHLNPEKTEKRDLGTMERLVGGESLRGRVGGAVTLAVGMANILTDAVSWTGARVEGMMKYWYHFAIMFEALFILTTIDTGTRIGRFLFQEVMGKVYKPFERPDWLPGSILATLAVTVGWGLLVYNGSIATIWPMFGIANQLLSVVALCLVTTLLINSGRARYAPVTLVPMLFVSTTTLSAGALMMQQFLSADWSILKKTLNVGLMLFVMTMVAMLLLLAVARWFAVLRGIVPIRPDEPPIRKADVREPARIEELSSSLPD
jgi:carbon starvation protein